MAGPSDLMWQPGECVWFDSIEFIVGARSVSHHTTPPIFLVSNRDISVELMVQCSRNDPEGCVEETENP